MDGYPEHQVWKAAMQCMGWITAILLRQQRQLAVAVAYRPRIRQ